MSKRPTLDPARVREEIAITAARMIAEDGADYATAKRKAARQVLGACRLATSLGDLRQAGIQVVHQCAHRRGTQHGVEARAGAVRER